MNWIALYFPRPLSSNQITDISPQVFEGLSTFSLLPEFHVVMFATISGKKRCSPRPYLQLFVGGRMSDVICVCLRKVTSSTFCVVLVLCCCFVCLRFLYPNYIVLSVFSNVYLRLFPLN